MYIKLDKQKMEVVVVCGILEKYEPTAEIKAIHKKVTALNEKMNKFMAKTVEPELAGISDMIEAENAKHIQT